MLLDQDAVTSATQSKHCDRCVVSDTSGREAEVSNEPYFSAAGISPPPEGITAIFRLGHVAPSFFVASFTPAKTAERMRLKVELYMSFLEEPC